LSGKEDPLRLGDGRLPAGATESVLSRSAPRGNGCRHAGDHPPDSGDHRRRSKERRLEPQTIDSSQRRPTPSLGRSCRGKRPSSPSWRRSASGEEDPLYLGQNCLLAGASRFRPESIVSTRQTVFSIREILVAGREIIVSG